MRPLGDCRGLFFILFSLSIIEDEPEVIFMLLHLCRVSLLRPEPDAGCYVRKYILFNWNTDSAPSQILSLPPSFSLFP